MRRLLHILIFLVASGSVAAQQKDPHDTPMYDEEMYLAIEAHVSDKIGAFENVWHEIVSPDIHVDILPVAPSEARPHWVFCTAGMSYREMTLPQDMQNRDFWLRGELTVALPGDWFGDVAFQDAVHDEAKYYPIRRLKQLARYPHNAATALVASHTFQFGEPLGPGTEMNSVVIWWPTFLEEGDDVVDLGDGRNVNIYSIIPIYEAERQYAVDNGTAALLEKLGAAGVTSVFDPTRAPVVQ